MWGNKLGWILSFAMLCIYGWVMWIIIAANTPASPTDFTRDPAVMGRLEFPPDIRWLFPRWDESADASADYEQAIADYEHNSRAYDRIIESKYKLDPADLQLPGIAALMRATNAGKLSLFEKHPEDVVTWESDPPRLNALNSVAQAALKLGLYFKVKDEPRRSEAKAEQCFFAAASLGYKMTRERICYREFQAGNAILGDAIASLIRLYNGGSSANTPRLEAFDQKRQEISKKPIMEIYRIISAIDDRNLLITRHAGDIVQLATSASERMWRVEATLKLGRTRYFAGRAGDQRFAERLLKKMAAEEPDPIVRLAAKLGRDLTLEQYRMLN